MRADQRIRTHAYEEPGRFYYGCADKKSYPSRRAAKGVLRAQLYQAYDGKIPEAFQAMSKQEYIAYCNGLGVYRCSLCKRWHLGHNRKYRFGGGRP